MRRGAVKEIFSHGQNQKLVVVEQEEIRPGRFKFFVLVDGQCREIEDTAEEAIKIAKRFCK